MLSNSTFRIVVDSTPLVSIDILPKQNNRILLGRRVNKPAQGYFFSVGGRIYKNETMDSAITRIARNELNLKTTSQLEFIGIFEHLYKDGFYKDISTHYVNLAYIYKGQIDMDLLPMEQHSEYQWFTINELLGSKHVHQYTKNYFKD